MKWISIKNKQPEINEIIFIRTEAPNLYIAQYEGEMKFKNISCILHTETMNEDKYFPVEYWIPIPELPDLKQ